MSNLQSKAITLFQEIDTVLEGSKHYTKEETEDNQNNFISAIVKKDIEYLQEYFPMLENEQIEKIKSLLA